MAAPVAEEFLVEDVIQQSVASQDPMVLVAGVAEKQDLAHHQLVAVLVGSHCMPAWLRCLSVWQHL